MDAENSHYSRLLHLRLSRVCVAIAATSPAEMLEKAEAIARDNPLIELRLDYIARPGIALPKIREFTETHPHVTVIATCRRAASGGKFKGPINSQLEILGKAAEAGCQLVDVELQTASRLKSPQFAKLRSKAAVILSFHDFRATEKLDETLKKMLAYPADFYKIVSTATSLYDNVTMMKFLERHQDAHSLVGLCMGDQGIISRVLGVRAGSAFTFAALTADERTAPGQVTAQELRSIYRIEQVDAATKVYGVAGDP
ncbi:MAG TPA: type I 3-dehydroquinate dehydratase, partial [Terriglobales bacterium]